MKKQKKQNFLTFIIIILVIALAVLLGSMAYEEAINMNKQSTKPASFPELDKEKTENEQENKKDDLKIEEDNNENEQNINNKDEENNIKEDETEYVGEEEKNDKETNSGKTTEEKVIDLAKQEWGEDTTVIFSIEEIKGNKYYVAVKSEATTVCWYLVDVETWEISEY